MLGLVLIAPVAAVTVHALRRRPVASIVHALLFFLIVADPVATLWLNSRDRSTTWSRAPTRSSRWSR
jgi:hypothetical protein